MLKIVNLLFIIYFFSFNNIYSKNIFNGLKRLSINDIQELSSININNVINESQADILVKDLIRSDQILEVDYKKNINDDYIFDISEAPIIENVYINGNEFIKDENIINFLKSKKNNFYNNLNITEDVNLIQNIYISNGFNDTSVSVTTEKYSESKINIIYSINEGSRVKLTKIYFYGNDTFSSDYLSSIIKSKEIRFYNFLTKGSNINQSLIGNDIAILNNFYKNKGFNNIDISYSINKSILNAYSLNFYINENKRLKVNQIFYNFSDKILLSEKYLYFENEFKTQIKKNNEFFDFDILNNFINNLNDLNSKNNTLLETKYNLEIINDKININFYDSTYTALIVNDIDIYGNTITKTNVLLSKIKIKPGDYLQDFKIKKSIDEIKNLKYINSVSYDKNIDGDKVDLNFDVEENKKTGNILLGGSFTGDVGLGLIFSIKDFNLMGSGNEINADFNINSEQALFDLSYILHPLGNSLISNKFNIKNQETDLTSSFGFKSEEQSLGYSILFDYSDTVTSSLGFNLSKSRGHAAINSSDTSISDNIGNFNDTIIRFSLLQNKTNDYLYPSDGYLNKFTIDFSPTQLSDNAYVKSTLYSDVYHNFKKSNDYIFLANRLGIANSINNSNLRTVNSFSLGGLNFKGFDYRGIGPKSSNNIYLGGNKYFTSTLGYGSSFIFDEKDNIYLRIFYTTGSLWDDDYSNTDFKLRSSFGTSFDLLSPVGPISFSYVIPIDRETNDNIRRFNFSIGTAF